VDETRGAALAAQEEVLDRLGVAVAGTPLTLCLESLPGRASDLPNGEVVRRVHERAATSFGFVLDTGHAHIAGDLSGLVNLAGRRLQSLHLHDNDGHGDQHLVPGEGTIDWVPFLRELRASGYEGPLMLEVQGAKAGNVEAELGRCRRVLSDLSRQAGGDHHEDSETGGG
jgi:sugar phosphate isomerase/epimerase